MHITSFSINTSALIKFTARQIFKGIEEDGVGGGGKATTPPDSIM
jgi:hypothetical protein